MQLHKGLGRCPVLATRPQQSGNPLVLEEITREQQ